MQIYPMIQRSLVVLLFGMAIIFVLVTLKSFFIPVALGLLFALAFFPISEQLEHAKVPRILGNFIIIILAVSIVVGFIGLFSLILRNFLGDIPSIETSIRTNVAGFQNYLDGTFPNVSADFAGWFATNIDLSDIFNTKSLGSLFTTTTTTIFITSLTMVYTFFFLYYRSKFKVFLRRVVSPERHQLLETILNEISHVAPRYILGIVIVVSILMVLNSIGFLLIGVNNALFFGVLAAIINIIPFLGTIIGFALVALFALLTQTPGIALGVVIMFFFIQFLENNILTPNITASQVSLNPLVAIVGVLVGNMIWGVVGMFVIIPFLAMIKIVCDHIPALQPVSFLLSTEGTEQHALTYRSFTRLFGKFKGK